MFKISDLSQKSAFSHKQHLNPDLLLTYVSWNIVLCCLFELCNNDTPWYYLASLHPICC